jgi:phosphoribosyl-dephospho-CoA transferase
VAVGIRGTERAQRFGAWIDDQDVESIVSPEDLVRVAPAYTRGALPAFVALAALRVRLDGFSWGPTGSAGFELATGAPTVRVSSDLDVLVRVSARPAQAVIRSLADVVFSAASQAGTRIDAQIETPAGGVALAELVEGKARVLARANDGPRLVADPWGI